MIAKDINRAWENIQENFKNSAKESLGTYGLEQQNRGLIKNVYVF